MERINYFATGLNQAVIQGVSYLAYDYYFFFIFQPGTAVISPQRDIMVTEEGGENCKSHYFQYRSIKFTLSLFINFDSHYPNGISLYIQTEYYKLAN